MSRSMSSPYRHGRLPPPKGTGSDALTSKPVPSHEFNQDTELKANKHRSASLGCKDATCLTLYVDAVCKGGDGAWSFAADIAGVFTIESGCFKRLSSPNFMALVSATKALQWYDTAPLRASSISVVSDSKWLIEGITDWFPLWVERKWYTRLGERVQFRSEWERLHALFAFLQPIDWKWVSSYPLHPKLDEACRKALNTPRVPVY